MSSTTHKILGFLFELAQMLHILLSERLLHLSQNNTLSLSCLIDFNKLSMSPSSLLTKCKANLSVLCSFQFLEASIFHPQRLIIILRKDPLCKYKILRDVELTIFMVI